MFYYFILTLRLLTSVYLFDACFFGTLFTCRTNATKPNNKYIYYEFESTYFVRHTRTSLYLNDKLFTVFILVLGKLDH